MGGVGNHAATLQLLPTSLPAPLSAHNTTAMRMHGVYYKCSQSRFKVTIKGKDDFPFNPLSVIKQQILGKTKRQLSAAEIFRSSPWHLGEKHFPHYPKYYFRS